MKPEHFEMDAPEPDDLGVEQEYLIDTLTTVSMAVTPGGLMHVGKDCPKYFEHNGFIWEVFEYPPGTEFVYS